MSPPFRWTSITILLLSLLPFPVAADDELASEADVASLALREHQLRIEVDERLRAEAFAAIEVEGFGFVTDAATTAQRPAPREGAVHPAKLAGSSRGATASARRPGDTRCTPVGHTLACVLVEAESR